VFEAALDWLKRPGAIPPAAGPGKVRVFRFGDRTNRGELLSELEKHGSADDREHFTWLMTSPEWAALRARDHAHGRTHKSPFVSLVRDPRQAVSSPDPTLQSIATTAPDLGVFDVPSDRLIVPGYGMSRQETEMLFHGGALSDHLVGWVPNPFRA
jgi:hypothetical protein